MQQQFEEWNPLHRCCNNTPPILVTSKRHGADILFFITPWNKIPLHETYSALIKQIPLPWNKRLLPWTHIISPKKPYPTGNIFARFIFLFFSKGSHEPISFHQRNHILLVISLLVLFSYFFSKETVFLHKTVCPHETVFPFENVSNSPKTLYLRAWHFRIHPWNRYRFHETGFPPMVQIPLLRNGLFLKDVTSDDTVVCKRKRSVLQTKYRPFFPKIQTKYRPIFQYFPKIQTIIIFA